MFSSEPERSRVSPASWDATLTERSRAGRSLLAGIGEEGHSMALQVGRVIRLISNENGARGGAAGSGRRGRAFGNDSGHDIKPGRLGGGDGGVNGAGRVCGAGSGQEARAAGTGLLGLGRTEMKPKTHC